jgi:2-dehydro-3-deoxyphosphogluconate aldolase/(4S)-4-hydroxy-2-oxoglutarate aldolase
VERAVLAELRTGLPDAVEAQRAVVVLRARSSEHVAATVDTLLDAGLTCMEVTFTLPDATTVIRELRRRFGTGLCVGAGTVITEAQCAEAIDVGAAFLVSPTFDDGVGARAASAGVPCLPGAMTPTEIARAWAAGASAVKIFPGGVLGPKFVAAVRDPMPEPLLVPSGGVEPANIAAWAQAGAFAVSLGGALVGDALAGGSQESLRSRAQGVRDRVAAAFASGRS